MQRETTMTETHADSVGFAISSSTCPHHLGFLSQRPKGSAIPDECFTCERILECMSNQPTEGTNRPETTQELPIIERTEDPVKEHEEKEMDEKSEKIEIRSEKADKSTKRASSDDFTIESPGMLYSHWSSTVLIRRETLGNWGKVKEVFIETPKGKKMACKVYPVDDLEKGIVQVPDRMQLKLGVEKGGTVKVKPAYR